MDRVQNFSDASEDEDDKVSRRVTTDILEVLNFYRFCVLVLVHGFGIYSPLYCFGKIKVPHHFPPLDLVEMMSCLAGVG